MTLSYAMRTIIDLSEAQLKELAQHCKKKAHFSL